MSFSASLLRVLMGMQGTLGSGDRSIIDGVSSLQRCVGVKILIVPR